MDFDILKVKFTHYNTVRVGRPFTIYEIEVRSSSTITWVIYKRYSDFYELHQALTHMQVKEGQLKEVVLPHLPPKRLTRSLAAEFVEKRKSELQEYVRDIIKITALIQSEVVIKFLDVPHSVRPMLFAVGNKKDFGGFETKELASDVSTKISMASKTPEERRILELLALLKGQNRVAAVKNFEEYFFENRPRLPGDVIKLLLQGKGDGLDEKEPGLVQTCGDFASSQVAARAALYLLCRLLDVEKNKDAQLFLDQFTALDASVLKKMMLHLHIVNERGNRLGAFRVVSVLRNSAANKVADLMVEQVVTDQWARTQYYQWAERKTDQVAPYVSEPQNPVLKSLSLTDLGYKSIAIQSCKDILSAASFDSGFRNVVQVGSTGADEDMTVLYKKDVAQDIVTLKIMTVLPYSVDVIASLCADLKRRREWDLKFHIGKRLAKLDANSDVVHLVFKSFSSPYKYRDFCLLRSMSKLEGKDGNGGMVLSARSCLHALGPECKDNVRAVLFPTGYLLTPMDVKDADKPKDGKEASSATNGATSNGTRRAAPPSVYTQFTFIAQMDRESVLIVSPDLLGETSELRDSIRNFEAVLARDYEAEYGVSAPIVPRALRQPKFVVPPASAVAGVATVPIVANTPPANSPISPRAFNPGPSPTPNSVRVTGFQGSRSANDIVPGSDDDMPVSAPAPVVNTIRPMTTGGYNQSAAPPPVINVTSPAPVTRPLASPTSNATASTSTASTTSGNNGGSVAAAAAMFNRASISGGPIAGGIPPPSVTRQPSNTTIAAPSASRPSVIATASQAPVKK